MTGVSTKGLSLQFFAAMLLIALIGPVFASGQDWLDQQVLADGKVAVYLHPKGEREQQSVSAAIVIPANLESVWSVMINCPEAPKFVPGLRQCEVIEGTVDSGVQIIEHVVKSVWFLPKLRYRFRASYQHQQQVAFERLSGDLKELRGRWSLADYGNGQTLVTYGVHVNPGFIVPQWLARSMLKRSLPDVLYALRERVIHKAAESTGQP